MRHHLSMSAGLGFLLIVCLLGSSLPAFAELSVAISSPRANSILSGRVKVTAAITGRSDFGYALLSVDSTGRSVTNSLPLRFEVDTTAFANGRHDLRVDIFSGTGSIICTTTVPVYMINGGSSAGTGDLPGLGSVADRTGLASMPLHRGELSVADLSATDEAAAVEMARAEMPATPASPSFNALVSAIDKGNPVEAQLQYIPMFHRNPLSILLDGQPLPFQLPPLINDGRTIVTLRPLIDALCGKISWNPAEKTCMAFVNDRQYAFTIGQDVVMLNGNPVPLDHPVYIHHGRTMVPVRVWASVFGGKVGYDARYRCVTLISNPEMTTARVALAQ